MKSYPTPSQGTRRAAPGASFPRAVIGVAAAAALAALTAAPAAADVIHATQKPAGISKHEWRCIRLGQVVWLHDRRTELQVARAGRLEHGSARDQRRVPRFIASSRDHRERAKYFQKRMDRLDCQPPTSQGAAVGSGPGSPQPGAASLSLFKLPVRTPLWQSGFETGDFSEWDHSFLNAGSNEQYPPETVIDPTSAGVPKLQGDHVADFQITQSDYDQGEIHAKVFKFFDPSQAAGTYTAWYYIPQSFTVGRNWVNIMQWKVQGHSSDGSFYQDPQWWINLVPNSVGRQYGAPVRGDNQPDIVRWHRDGKWQAVNAPLGRWFEITADVHPNDQIDFSIDGQPFDTISSSEGQVGPRSGDEKWVFGVGNYVNAPSSSIYIDGVSFSPF